ncbi:MAG TPA: hypothetical protein VIQ97_04485 [Prevotella sp.]
MKHFLILSLLTLFSLSSFSEDRVGVNITLKNQKSGTITLTAKKTSACASYGLLTMTSDIANMINDGNMAEFMKKNKRCKKFTENLKKVNMVEAGFVGLPNTDYTLFVLPFDHTGNAGIVERHPFKTPNVPVAGSPKIDVKVVSVGPDSVSVEFSPNADVAGYAICQIEAGAADSLLRQHGRILGFSNLPDMIRSFSGKDYLEKKTHTWNELAPNTAYEYFAQGWDKNGRYMDLVKIPAKTGKLGGPGEATVNITVGDFAGSDATGYFQIVLYAPNDQAALHRDIIITEEAYNKADMGDEGVIKLLQQEAPNDPYWNQYRVDKAQWNATPNTAYIACSIAKNVNGEWGPLQKVRFVTPAQPAQ